MQENIKYVLEKLENNNFEAYIIGGYVREKLLNDNDTCDIDITTNAKPKDIAEIFKDFDIKSYDYGNISFDLDKYKFDITTFRKDLNYIKSRKPDKIIYVDSLLEDLKRRDFTINTICIDKDNNIIDYYDGRRDLKRKIIRSVGDPDLKIKEDALRILRAVRFATIHKFKLDNNLKQAIIKNCDLVKELSYERKKYELNKIFCSEHKKYGIKLLKQLGLIDPLELKNIDNILLNNEPIGMWSTITDKDYSFTKKEKKLISKINELLDKDINDPLIQYKYGLYPLNIVSNLKKLNTKKIVSNYEKLPIKDRNEIKINADEICAILNEEPGIFIKDIFEVLEEEIIYKRLENDKEEIKKFIINNF